MSLPHRAYRPVSPQAWYSKKMISFFLSSLVIDVAQRYFSTKMRRHLYMFIVFFLLFSFFKSNFIGFLYSHIQGMHNCDIDNECLLL